MTTTAKGKGAPGATAHEQKPEISKTEINPNGKPQSTKEASVEEKILKVNILQERISSRAKVLSHLEKIEALKFGEFDEKDSLSISDGKNTYLIKSPLLMRKVQQTMREELKAELVKIEAEIQF